MVLSFAGTCRERGVGSLAVFGDSITEGVGATAPERRWTDRLAAALGAAALCHEGLSGTVLQSSLLADGLPRPGNGVSRFRDALLGEPRCDAVAILYGYNDARYTAAPAAFNLANFIRDYRNVVEGLLAGGFSPEAICLGSPPYIPDAGFAVGSAGFTGQTRSGFEAFVRATERIAADYGVFYAQVYESMQARGDGALASPDVTHPGDEGHAVIASAFAAARPAGR